MILFKDKLTIAIAEAAQTVLDESAFDDAALKWADQADENDIDGAIDSFKQLKARSLLKGAEADISPWIKKPFKDFSNFVDSKSEVLKKKDVSKQTEKDVVRIFENEFVVIVSPNTFEASKKYGANTKWCISGNVKDHWDEYIKKGIKFYFILPKKNKKKLAVSVWPGGQSKHVFDVKDETVSEEEYEPLLKAYKIPSNIIKVIHSNKTDWNVWLKNIGGVKNEDGTVDVNGDVILQGRNLTEFPFKFKTVTGNFKCGYNELRTLEGGPQSVGGDFTCSHNNLTTLKGAPQSVGRDFDCAANRLTSLKGGPQKIGSSYSCWANKLTTLEGGPQSVNGNFHCNNNQLTSLKGGPQTVKDGLFCHYNELTSLEGAPQKLEGMFNCAHNQLTSLKGGPKIVGLSFNCSDNLLKSLEGAPHGVSFNFTCNHNAIKFTKKDVQTVCKINANVAVTIIV